MSWQATTTVTESSSHKGSDLLCMLMLANYASPELDSICPSIPRLAKDCRMSQRAVRYIVKRLIASGELVEYGEGMNNTKMYRIALQRLQVSPAKIAVPERPSPAIAVSASPAIAVAAKQSGKEEKNDCPPELFSLSTESEPSGRIPPSLSGLHDFRTAWCEFVESRRKRRKPLTPRAASAILNRLAERPDQATDVVDAMLEFSWDSFDWSWEKLQKRISGPVKNGHAIPNSQPKNYDLFIGDYPNAKLREQCMNFHAIPVHLKQAVMSEFHRWSKTGQYDR